jgi:hypothetical protein
MCKLESIRNQRVSWPRKETLEMIIVEHVSREQVQNPPDMREKKDGER